MPLHDVNYQHWQGVHQGLWRRRVVIARNGLASCLHTKPMPQVIVFCWGAALAMAGVLFVIGQLLVADSVVVHWIGNFNPELQSFARFLTTWLEEHPEISVRTTQDVLFYFFCLNLMSVSIFALGVALPSLITRDLASNAITIYSSKAVSLGDYLLGKFSTAMSLLALCWLGPVIAAWFMGNLMAPDWRFFWHSRVALGHALAYGLSSMVVLSLLALGISALSTKEKSTPVLWYMWWVVGGVVGPIAQRTQPWLRHFSFNYNLDQLGRAIFRPTVDLKIAQDHIPILGQMLRSIRPETMAALYPTSIGIAGLSLFLMAAGAVVVIRTRVKPS